MEPPGAVDREFWFFLYIVVLLFFVVFLFPVFPCFLGPPDPLRRAPGSLRGSSRDPPGPPGTPQDYLMAPSWASWGTKCTHEAIGGNIILDYPEGTTFWRFWGRNGSRHIENDLQKVDTVSQIDFFFRNAPSNLPVDLPRTRDLRGMRFANLEKFQVLLSKIWTCMKNWEANVLLACTPA